MPSEARLEISLNGNWLLKDFAPGEGEAAQVYRPGYEGWEDWLPAQVPGDVHTSLLAAGRIPDPFYHTNVEQVQWVEQREWWYRTTFAGLTAPGNGQICDRLTFEGLDTYATVYLNGECLGQHRNMFRPATFDVIGKLNYGGNNTLAVRLDPPGLYLANRAIEGQWGDYNANERVFARKTQSQFSWDWSPRLVNQGIWQEVRLERFETARLNFPYFRTLAASPAQATVQLETEVESWGEVSELEIRVSLKRGSFAAGLKAPVVGGRASLVLNLTEPELWWPQSYGAQALYDLEVTLWQGRTLLDIFSDKVGICTVTLDRSPDPDEPGSEFFTFVVNGVPIFAKGANWIPADALNGRLDRQRYEELLRLFVEANGNMLRVWGGGQYERDEFYRLADELGILVWQDFMFACGLYPDFDPDFVEEVRREAEYQVRRLRNRPCLALWVGNNENDWVEDVTRWREPGHDFPGKLLYHEVLPEIVARLDPAHLYWPSSPFGGNDHNGEQAGDRHNWYVWHGNVFPRHFGEEPLRDWSPAGVSYRHYGEDSARFISEFGIHALPVLETVRRNVPSEELYFGSPGLLFRNKDNPKDKGNMLMLAHTGLPRDLPEYIDFSMITQAEGLKYGIEHYRRRKFHCSGALVWQWNDCWPGLTWSVVDYYGFPKAGYYYVKRAFAPLLASFQEEQDGGINLWLTNDTLSPVRETLSWKVTTFQGEILRQGQVEAEVATNSSRVVVRLSPEMLGKLERNQVLLWVSSASGRAPDNRYFLGEVKDWQREKPGVQVNWEQDGPNLLAHFSSSAFAYFVRFFVPIEGVRYSDNWFDLFPGEPRTVKIWHPGGKRLRSADFEIGWR